jgi:hypothetical protein
MNNLVNNALISVAIELIECRNTLQELERSFPYMSGGYYYIRKEQMVRREAECVAILKTALTEWDEQTPIQQFLVTKLG